ncbi:PLP-dependent aminotransferase family protein [Paraconexibacter sp.]|uniref:MocR-like pyridoxine biosynthesis transcription factor PdxR n=1 Tax=Paraconexibacter sp. TaxID=2949640 RepID=UPI0035675DBA
MRDDGANSGPELLLTLRRGAGAPALGIQVEDGLREAIRAGRLRSGDRLPPSRTLAHDLAVARRTVVGAYEQLVAEGWLEARTGSGTFVRRALPGLAVPASAAVVPAAPEAPAGPGRLRYHFFPGHPDLSAFPRAEWGRAVRAALRDLPDSAFGYGDPRGHRELRVALAGHLARTRGVVCRPRQIVICQGAVQALALLVRSHAERGAPRVVVEDPYLPEHRDVLAHAGADVVPVPVDGLGIRDESLVAARPDIALVTPAHQCPTGVVLAAGRRAAICRWAQESTALVVEDDYDAEYRYDRAPVAAVQSLAPDQVAYLGSTSKTLAPGIRLAWLVVPEDRLERVVAAKRYADAGSPVLEQAALARLITSGAYDRHVRAARRRQRERRDALVAAVGEHLPDARIEGAAAGLHAVVRLARPVGARELVAAAREREVGVHPLSEYRADPSPETTGVVLGYGALAVPAVREGVRRLAAALSEVG